MPKTCSKLHGLKELRKRKLDAVMYQEVERKFQIEEKEVQMKEFNTWKKEEYDIAVIEAQDFLEKHVDSAERKRLIEDEDYRNDMVFSIAENILVSKFIVPHTWTKSMKCGNCFENVPCHPDNEGLNVRYCPWCASECGKLLKKQNAHFAYLMEVPSDV